jgi:amidophosphoribosyltransferase
VCAIVGISGHPEAARLVRDGLFALQHRGEQACGLVVGSPQHHHKGLGLVEHVLPGTLTDFPGTAGLGHNRYVTSGGDDGLAAQPFWVTTPDGKEYALANNGNLPQLAAIQDRLKDTPFATTTENDGEALLHLICHFISQGDSTLEALQRVLNEVDGAYAFVFLDGTSLWGVRDRFGYRPLMVGQLEFSSRDETQVALCLASETAALDTIRARVLREVQPGEIVSCTGAQLETWQKPTAHHAHCVFELIYFARPDSRVFNIPVASFRRRLGQVLARIAPVEADVVIGIPDSAIDIAQGYAEEAGLPLRRGLVRSHYVGRTFIAPAQRRERTVRLKFNPVVEDIAGNRVVLIDDSIVRGTSMERLLTMIRGCRPQSIHLRIASPPIVDSCFMGIDTPTRKELIAATSSVEQIARRYGVASLAFLPIPALQSALAKYGLPNNFCGACFDGQYALELPPALRERVSTDVPTITSFPLPV